MVGKTLRFVLKFFLLFGVMETALFMADISFLEGAITSFEAAVLGLPYAGNMVLVNGQAFRINESCTGLASGIMLASIVFALRKPGIREKAGIFIAGFAALFCLNLARVCLVLLSAELYGAGFAEMLHVASWFAAAGLVLLLWHALTKRIAGISEFRQLL